MIEVAVVILNYNGKQYLQKFLPDVLQHSPEAEVIVADNCSTDGSQAWLSEHFPNIRLLQLPQNYGFSKGYNQALRQVEAKFYVLLNSDIAVGPGWLAPLLALMRSNTQIAACQPCIRAYHRPDHYEHAGAAGGFIDLMGYPFCRGRLFEHTEPYNPAYADVQETFWATGACMMVRSEAYWQVGGLDDDFFAHMEEIDLCWRLKNAGHKIFYCGLSEVYHVGGGTLAYTSPFKSYLNFRNGLVMLLKNMPLAALLWVLPLRLVLDGVAGLRFLATGYAAHCWQIVRAHFYLYGHAPSIWRKRKAAQAQVIGHSHAQIMQRSVVWLHFVKKINTFEALGFKNP